jgi:hypothetical protein
MEQEQADNTSKQVYQERMNKLIGQLPDAVSNDNKSLDHLLQEISKVKSRSAGEHPEYKITFDSVILKNLVVDDRTLSRISGVLNGLMPLNGMTDKLKKQPREQQGLGI